MRWRAAITAVRRSPAYRAYQEARERIIRLVPGALPLAAVTGGRRPALAGATRTREGVPR
jgi:hypothetical protein